MNGRPYLPTVCFAVAAGVAMFATTLARADSLFQHPMIREIQPVLMALPDFRAGSVADADAARAISQIVASDLRRSGVFSFLSTNTVASISLSFDVPPQFEDWRAIKAQELVTGRVTQRPDGRIKVEFRLWDVFGGVQLAGQQYLGTADDLSAIGHMISDTIYEHVTGKKASSGPSASP
jgi:TolB protein